MCPAFYTPTLPTFGSNFYWLGAREISIELENGDADSPTRKREDVILMQTARIVIAM